MLYIDAKHYDMMCIRKEQEYVSKTNLPDLVNEVIITV